MIGDNFDHAIKTFVSKGYHLEDYERALVFDIDGSLLLHHTSHERDNINWEGICEDGQLEDTIMVHNHPPDFSFYTHTNKIVPGLSGADVGFSLFYGLHGIVAIGKTKKDKSEFLISIAHVLEQSHTYGLYVLKKTKNMGFSVPERLQELSHGKLKGKFEIEEYTCIIKNKKISLKGE